MPLHFRLWHFSDMPTASDDVRCRGKTGSARRTAKMTRLTLSGHPTAIRHDQEKFLLSLLENERQFVTRRFCHLSSSTGPNSLQGGQSLQQSDMAWAAHTHYWTLDTGASVWLTTSAKRRAYPPEGIDLPILLGDGTVINSTVFSSSPAAIVIELDGCHLRRLDFGTPLNAEAEYIPRLRMDFATADLSG